MKIQWYPGHMHKAKKLIKQALPQVDLIIEILDARIPVSSENPMLQTLRGDKPYIKILTKCDLADAVITKQWQNWLEQQKGVKTLALSNKHLDKMRQVTELCCKLLPHKANSDRGIHAMILGIPNVGKSTLINTLAGRIIAKTGNEPAITKSQQRIRISNNITLFDTPGVLWPNIEDANAGYRLAATGAIKDTAIDHEDVALYLAEFLLHYYPQSLQKRFEIEQLPDSDLQLLEIIGHRRGCLRTGGQVLLDKVSKILLTEFRTGGIGAITLETPDMIEIEIEKLEILRQQKAEKKSQRKKQKTK